MGLRTTLTLTQGAQVASQGTGDLLMLSPMAGCIRHFSTNMGDFQNLSLSAVIPFTTDARLLSNNHNNVFLPWMTSVRNCTISGTIPNSNAAIGNIGVLLGQAGLLENTQVNGLWMGVRLAGGNIKITCCTFEVGCYAIVVGALEFEGTPLGPAGASNFIIENCEMEGCYGAMNCYGYSSFKWINQ